MLLRQRCTKIRHVFLLILRTVNFSRMLSEKIRSRVKSLKDILI